MVRASFQAHSASRSGHVFFIKQGDGPGSAVCLLSSLLLPGCNQWSAALAFMHILLKDKQANDDWGNHVRSHFPLH